MSQPGIPRLTGFEQLNPPAPEPPPSPGIGWRIVNAIGALVYRAWRALGGENPK